MVNALSVKCCRLNIEGIPPRVTSDHEQPSTTPVTPRDEGQESPALPSDTSEDEVQVASPPENAVVAEPAAPEFVEAAEVDEEAEGAEPEAPDSRHTMVIGLSVLAVVLVGILIAILATGGGGGESPGTASPSTTRPPAAGPTLPASAFTTFHDDLTGFTIQYPTVWPRAQAPVSEVRFAVTAPQGAAVSVRMITTEQATTPQNLANMKSVTEGIIALNPSAKILKTDVITLNGLIGYYYLYTFKDKDSGLDGVHAHYFLFQGHKMYSMVFQVLPADLFASAAGVFDQMAQSFKVDPEPPSTTAP